MNLDIINGSYEFLSACFCFNNCRILYKDKQVRGVSYWSIAFFISWGFWNLIYYPTLGQTFSFLGGIGIVVANSLWLSMAIYYRYKRNNIEVNNGEQRAGHQAYHTH